ncbi:MAG: hypothetical protein ACUVQG_10055 [Thermogutta sp.]
MNRSVWRIAALVGAFLLGLSATWLLGADPAINAPQTPALAASEAVDLFTAIGQKVVEVKLIPKNSNECNVVVKNKTDKPLTIRMPETFAGVPVLAQLGGIGGDMGYGGGRRGGYGGYGGGGYGGGAQGFGGGFGGGYGGYGGYGGGYGGYGGGIWNVPPEKVVQVKIPIVCLDHGKPDPNPRIPYEIKPIESYAKCPEVNEVLKMLANGKIPQRVAQVAAWHFQNGLTLEELARKEIRTAIGLRVPYFSPAEIQAAVRVVAEANRLVMNSKKESPVSPSPGELKTSDKN